MSVVEETIARIAQLYAVEKEARGSPPDRRAELRSTHSAPVFDDLERWLAMQLTTISGKSPLAAAIRYALARIERMRPYLDHGILELDNNAAERGMRAVATAESLYTPSSSICKHWNRVCVDDGLCCTNSVKDSSRESSVVAGWHEQTDTHDLQDHELASLQ